MSWELQSGFLSEKDRRLVAGGAGLIRCAILRDCLSALEGLSQCFGIIAALDGFHPRIHVAQNAVERGWTSR
jgi:hypothetical protein